MIHTCIGTYARRKLHFGDWIQDGHSTKRNTILESPTAHHHNPPMTHPFSLSVPSLITPISYEYRPTQCTHPAQQYTSPQRRFAMGRIINTVTPTTRMA